MGLPQVEGCYRDTEEHCGSDIAMGRPQNASKPAKLEQNKVNQFTHGVAQLNGLALIKSQGNFTQVNAKLAHLRAIDHDFVVHQIHPVIELHVINCAVDW
jgi:hypothetical protein